MVTAIELRRPESTAPTDTEVSSYLQYLPAIYRDNMFLGRFLCIMESVMKPIEGIIDNIACYFDPYLTPEEFLPWLAGWVGLTQDELAAGAAAGDDTPSGGAIPLAEHS